MNFRQQLWSKWSSVKGKVIAFHSNATPNWLQTYGTIVSIFTAVAALLLSIHVSNQNTKVEKMDSLLNEMISYNRKMDTLNNSQRQTISKQDSQLKSLTMISDRALSTVDNLEKLQKLYFEQNRTMQVNSAPSIQFTGKWAFTEHPLPSTEKSLHTAQITNSGQRDATNLKGFVSCVLSTTIETVVIKETVIPSYTLKPNFVLGIIDTIELNRDWTVVASKGMIYRYEFVFTDPLTKKQMSSYEYFLHDLSGFDILNTRTVAPNERMLVDKAIIKARRRLKNKAMDNKKIKSTIITAAQEPSNN